MYVIIMKSPMGLVSGVFGPYADKLSAQEDLTNLEDTFPHQHSQWVWEVASLFDSARLTTWIEELDVAGYKS